MPTINVTFAAFMVIVIGILVAVVIALPQAVPIDPAYLTMITNSFGTLKAWNSYLPITEGLVMLGIILSIEIATWFWRNTSRIIRFIRGTNSS